MVAKLLVHKESLTDLVEKFDIQIPSNVKIIEGIAVRCIDPTVEASETKTLSGLATVLMSGGHETIVSDAEVELNNFRNHISKCFTGTSYYVEDSSIARVVYKHTLADRTGSEEIRVYIKYRE